MNSYVDTGQSARVQDPDRFLIGIVRHPCQEGIYPLLFCSTKPIIRLARTSLAPSDVDALRLRERSTFQPIIYSIKVLDHAPDGQWVVIWEINLALCTFLDNN